MSFTIILLGLLVVAALSSFVTVQQGTIAVITVFGKYQRIFGTRVEF